MLKLVYAIDRRGDLSERAFYDYWLHQHAPLVCRHAKATGIRRYVQSHTVPSPSNDRNQARGMRPPLAGVATLWWDSLETFQLAQASPEGQAAFAEVVADEANFINASGSFAFLTVEHAIFDYTDEKPLNADTMKYAYLVARRGGMTLEACHKTWRQDHAALVTRVSHTVNMAKYVQSHAIAPEVSSALAAARGWAAPLDGLTEVWMAAPGASRSSPEEKAAAGEAMLEDERRFVDLTRSYSFLTKEHVIFDAPQRASA